MHTSEVGHEKTENHPENSQGDVHLLNPSIKSEAIELF